MDKSEQFVVFLLDEKQYALRLFAVEKIVRAVEITLLPKAPEIVYGIINAQGRIIPVVNVRKRFRLPEREIGINDQFIITNTLRNTVVLVADAVSGVVERSEQEMTTAGKIVTGMGHVEGIVKLKDGMILILDLDEFLSLDEEKKLDTAMKKHKSGSRK